jgi:hypothetical protein
MVFQRRVGWRRVGRCACYCTSVPHFAPGRWQSVAEPTPLLCLDDRGGRHSLWCGISDLSATPVTELGMRGFALDECSDVFGRGFGKDRALVGIGGAVTTNTAQIIRAIR